MVYPPRGSFPFTTDCIQFVIICLVIEPTHLKNMRQSIRIISWRIQVKIKHIWNHHLVYTLEMSSKKSSLDFLLKHVIVLMVTGILGGRWNIYRIPFKDVKKKPVTSPPAILSPHLLKTPVIHHSTPHRDMFRDSYAPYKHHDLVV